MSNSNSLWGETVILYGTNFADHFAIAYLVVSFVTFSGILYAWLSSHDALLRKAAFKFLVGSMICYLLAYSLQIIDIFLHEKKLHVKWGYTFTNVFQDGWLQLSDFVVLMIVCRITYYQFPIWGANAVFHGTWRFLCMCSLTTLAALALYRWAVTTAYTIMALNGVSSTWLQRFVYEAAVLRTGYQVLYLLVSTFIILLTVYYLGRRTAFREKLNIVEGQFFAIGMLLWIRSIARADIVVKYTLHEATRPDYLNTAAEACYGLPTVVIYVLFNRLNKSDPASVAKSDILREGRRTARKELKRRRIDALKGGPELPTPAQMLTEIELKPLAYLPDLTQTSLSPLTDTEVQDTLSRHIKDVLRLREKI